MDIYDLINELTTYFVERAHEDEAMCQMANEWMAIQAKVDSLGFDK